MDETKTGLKALTLLCNGEPFAYRSQLDNLTAKCKRLEQ